jgi:hypothetical protein
MLSYAFFRLESALTIALTIVLLFLFPTPFAWWRWWYWLLIGVIAESLIIYTSMSDVATGARVVAEMLRQEFNPEELRSKKYRERMERALEYRERIEGVVRLTREGVLKEHLNETAREITDWLAQIFRLSKRLDAYEADEVIRRDIRSVPSSIKNLKERLEEEDDEEVRKQLRQTIAGKEAQLESLRRLQNTMEMAEYQLESTLTALGMVYSQLLLLGAKDVKGARARRLREEIAEQIASLQDLLSAMDEVYKAS